MFSQKRAVGSHAILLRRRTPPGPEGSNGTRSWNAPWFNLAASFFPFRAVFVRRVMRLSLVFKKGQRQKYVISGLGQKISPPEIFRCRGAGSYHYNSEKRDQVGKAASCLSFHRSPRNRQNHRSKNSGQGAQLLFAERCRAVRRVQNCREITSGSLMDVQEIDGASNNSVDAVREISGAGQVHALFGQILRLHRGRSPYAFDQCLQCAAENSRGAAGACDIHVRHHRVAQDPCHDSFPDASVMTSGEFRRRLSRRSFQG